MGEGWSCPAWPRGGPENTLDDINGHSSVKSKKMYYHLIEPMEDCYSEYQTETWFMTSPSSSKSIKPNCLASTQNPSSVVQTSTKSRNEGWIWQIDQERRDRLVELAKIVKSVKIGDRDHLPRAEIKMKWWIHEPDVRAWEGERFICSRGAHAWPRKFGVTFFYTFNWKIC